MSTGGRTNEFLGYVVLRQISAKASWVIVSSNKGREPLKTPHSTWKRALIIYPNRHSCTLLLREQIRRGVCHLYKATYDFTFNPVLPLLHIHSENTPLKYKVTCSHGSSFISSLSAAPICWRKSHLNPHSWKLTGVCSPVSTMWPRRRGKTLWAALDEAERKQGRRVKEIYCLFLHKRKKKFINVNKWSSVSGQVATERKDTGLRPLSVSFIQLWLLGHVNILHIPHNN